MGLLLSLLVVIDKVDSRVYLSLNPVVILILVGIGAVYLYCLILLDVFVSSWSNYLRSLFLYEIRRGGVLKVTLLIASVRDWAAILASSTVPFRIITSMDVILLKLISSFVYFEQPRFFKIEGAVGKRDLLLTISSLCKEAFSRSSPCLLLSN